jgi:uroporphyrinogen decarboxylase
MTPRENLLSLYRKQGYERAPVCFVLCPSLENEFKQRYPSAESYADEFGFPFRLITDPAFPWIAEIPGFVPERKWDRTRYFDTPVHPQARMDIWGVAHEPGSAAAKHMTHMRHPLQKFQTLEEFQAYPWPEFEKADWSFAKREVDALHARGLAAQVWMECTIWETAWYLRGMEELMMDMMGEEEQAVFLLDKITDLACFRARKYAEAGADIIALGDDIGMQSSPMMARRFYAEWLKPRLRKVIQAAKVVKPDVIIQYHSCGYIIDLIPELIDAGIDVLNPVQPESMDVMRVFNEFGGKLSFNGSLGTQTLMPFGTPQDVRDTVKRNLDFFGTKGGLLCCPTHMLEPEVPWENIEAYLEACRQYRT